MTANVLRMFFIGKYIYLVLLYCYDFWESLIVTDIFFVPYHSFSHIDLITNYIPQFSQKFHNLAP